MLPQRVTRATSPHARASPPWPRLALYALAVVSSIYALRFVYSKCDTRAHMSVLLTKTTAILKANDVEYWLDKGTLLGVHRDAGLIPWEYDVDLGVMNATCSEISALKHEFASVGLVAYDRSDYIPHKVKITYDTENHHFYWSDPYMHDPCIRVYDVNDVSTWVDIYWYVEVDAAEVATKRTDILVPPGYDGNSSLLCCSEGLQEFTDHMCCGGCVPYASVFPLQKQRVFVPDGVHMTQEQFVPRTVPEFLKIQYGRNALESREIKGWKGIVCGFWTNPLLFAVHLATLVGVALLLALCGCMPCQEMDDEFAMSSPRSSPKRMSSRYARMASRKESPDDAKSRMKGDMHLTRELIDFDVIKGSAFFHTKPSNHDKKLVKEGIKRVLFVPFHASFWKQKPLFYEVTTAMYLLHVLAICIYVLRPKTMSTINAFEVAFPVVLLALVAIGYGRVTSTLQAGDPEPAIAKLVSPTKASGSSNSACPPHRAAPVPSLSTLSSASSGIGSDLAESENSDSTDSEEDSGDSSSSDDEAPSTTNVFAPSAAPSPAPSPLGFPPSLGTPHTPRSFFDRESADPFARRRVTVCVWENGEPKKRAMSIAELRNTILAKVKATPPRMAYRKIAQLAALTLSLVPVVLRVVIKCQESECLSRVQEPLEVIYWLTRMPRVLTLARLYAQARACDLGAALIALSCMFCTYSLAFAIFSALADAEVTYHRRFLYAKCFTALTSSRRSRLMKLPHFRLKNVVNIKAWIALRGGRTWLKRQGRQRAADEIVSTSFLINLVMLVVMGMQAVSEGSGGIQQQSLIHVEVTMWCLLSSIFMLRFMMLGSNINKKYQNTSLLLTEQMNVYLRLLVKPHKKEKLLVSNNVLKLASKLLKELNSPNKVSGLTMNPLLYNITRVVVLSAFSSTASEFFGFKLKLWKMKSM